MELVKQLAHESDSEFARRLREMAELVRRGVGDTEEVAEALEAQARRVATIPQQRRGPWRRTWHRLDDPRE
jgi:hypothetical protein